MPDVHTSESSITETINELYWNSDHTVDDIVNELGIGRNTLYSSVQPQPAGASCPDCGTRLVFTNRSNRNHDLATCRDCGIEVDLAEGQPGAEIDRAEPEAVSHGHHGDEHEVGWSRWRNDLAGVAPERVAMIGGAAVLGVMFGAVAARAVREM